MANSITKDLRKKTSAELAELIAKCKEQLLQIRFNIANGEVEKQHIVPEIRRTVARALTILNERAIQLKLSKTQNDESNVKKEAK